MRRIVLALFLLGLSAPGHAEEAVMNSSAYILDHPNLSRKVSLALNDTNIVDALVYLSEKAEINVAVSKSVQGRATLSLNNVSIRDALDIILLSNELALEKRGDIFYVMPASDYEQQHGERWSEVRQVRIFKLRYARPADVLLVLGNVKSRVGSVVADPESGTIVLMDTPEKLNQMKKTIETLDQEQVAMVFDLKYANAKDVETYLQPRLDAKGSGSIKADEKYNRVIVTALPGKMDEVKKLVEKLDAKIKQVLIEAKIVQVSLEPDFEYGVDWQRLLNRDLLTIDSTFPLDPTLTSFGTLKIGKLGAANVDATIKLLKTVGETKLLSSPRITALNNEEAKIFVGTREVYTTSTTTQGSDLASTAVTVNFVDVGISLKVTPTINEDGMILMKIAPEVSRVDRMFETSTGDLIPVVDTTNATTRVMVADGSTIIIGGLIRDEQQRDTEKFPVLGDIPILGSLFKHVREDKEKTELVVFLTPHIIDGEKSMTDFDKKKMKPLRGYDA
jgi:type IV pilus assembly protein PilQ